MAKLSGESDFECLIPALPTVAVHPSEIMVLHLLQALTYYLLHLVSTKLVSSILSACQNSASDKSTMVELCILHVNLKLTLVSEAHPQCNTSAVMQSTVKDTDRLRVRRVCLPPAAWSSRPGDRTCATLLREIRNLRQVPHFFRHLASFPHRSSTMIHSLEFILGFAAVDPSKSKGSFVATF